MFDNTVNVLAGSDAVFEKKEYERRQDELREVLRRRKVDLLLVTKPENIFFLSGQQTVGYYTFQCLGVPAKGEPFLILWELEGPQARANTFIADIAMYYELTKQIESVADIIKKRGWKGRRVAIERTSWFIPVEMYEKLEKALGKLQDGSRLVEPLRAIKSEAELNCIERAAFAVEAATRAALPLIRVGVSENEVAAAVHDAMFRAGSEWVAMGPFLVSGPRSGLRHAVWRRRGQGPGDTFTIEIAAAYNRYHSAIFRTACVPPVPDKVRRFRDTCIAGLEAALAKLKPGNTCADVHNAVQRTIDKAGLTDHFRKRSGYSMGVAFAPGWGEGDVIDLAPENKTLLKPGMVFHIPVTLCDYGRFTTGASETAVVTASGNRPLNAIDRALF